LTRVVRNLLVCLSLALAIAESTPLEGQELTNEDCLLCHSDEDLTKESSSGEVLSLYVDEERYAEAVHGFLSCTDCHSGIHELPHQETLPPVDCAECHVDVVEEYEASSHGVARQADGGDAPDCESCHGDIHLLVPIDDTTSPVHPLNLPETCGKCHANPELVAEYGIHVARPIAAYEHSVHYRAIQEGKDAATCNDCHTAHHQLPGSDPRSSVYRPRIPETCGQCHQAITKVYNQSIHGTAVIEGILEAPVCSDCHGEHNILSPEEPGSPVSPTNLPLQTCGRCHANVRLSEKYGLPLNKVPSYENSYHGLAARAGSQTVASCASCHGVHDILPSSDPRSHVYPSNLSETCGRCHPGAGTRFAIGPVHVVGSEEEYPVVYYIRLFYLPLIFLTIGGMVLHVGADFMKKARTPALRSLAATPASPGAPERMMRGFRIAHGLVVISFPVLVYSGFALTYPESWWAWPIEALGPGARGLIHRVAAVLLLGSLLYHVIHLMKNRRARQCIKGMKPSVEDWRELKERLKYYVGLREEPVHSPLIGYIEKAEYLAFWWGMIVMAATGLLLWFENFTLKWLPSWVPSASTSIHFYEAVLATLAILVWHFYWTIFDPAVYPMDMSWVNGKAPASREAERQPHGAVSVMETVNDAVDKTK
jgi:cytochrome b subunit of formate dehydrogenase